MTDHPTERPPGRPTTKAYRTLVARAPQDLVDRVHAYASLHHRTMASFIREGVAWRIAEDTGDARPPHIPPHEDARPPHIPPHEDARPPGIPPHEDVRPPGVHDTTPV